MPGTVLGSRDIAKSLSSLSLHSMEENRLPKMCTITSGSNKLYEEKFKKVRKKRKMSVVCYSILMDRKILSDKEDISAN